MSRWEFMGQLELLLSDISPNEREEALQYYNDYFNDAGMENEQEVIEALGSPQQVAQIVKDELAGGIAGGEFTENGFASGIENTKNELAPNSRKMEEESEEPDVRQDTVRDKPEGLPTWAIVLLVIAAVLLSPVWIGLLISLAGIIVSAFAVVFSLVIGLAVAMLALYIVAIALVIAGFGCILPRPVAGLGLLGAGLICGALGILFMLLTVLLFGKGIPALCSAVSYIWNSIFKKKGGAQA